MTIKEKIFNKIAQIENPVLLQELDLYLDELDIHELHPENPLLEQSITQAIGESQAGLGIPHEQIWERLKQK